MDFVDAVMNAREELTPTDKSVTFYDEDIASPLTAMEMTPERGLGVDDLPDPGSED